MNSIGQCYTHTHKHTLCKTHGIHLVLNMPDWDRHVIYFYLFSDRTVSLCINCVCLLYLLNLFVPQHTHTHKNTIHYIQEVGRHSDKNTPHTHILSCNYFQHEDHRMIKLSSVFPSSFLCPAFGNHCLFIVFIFSTMNSWAFCWYPTSWWLTD